jgi:hypothetical protein
VSAADLAAARARAVAAEDRVAELEDGLHQAVWSIEFLHGCLTDERYSYEYPEHTSELLTRLRTLAPPPPLCVQSRTEPGCPACEARVRKQQARVERQLRTDVNAAADANSGE